MIRSLCLGRACDVGIQRRFAPSVRPPAFRGPDPGASGPGDVLEGHASVFDQWTVLWETKRYRWREIVRKGAFAEAIREKQDVRSLWNHDANYVLGRTTSGTLELSEDDVGLFSRTYMPTSDVIRGLVSDPVKRGDVNQMSFAFRFRDGGYKVTSYEDRESGMYCDDVEILSVDLFDVSPVTYPAYKGTDCGFASLSAAAEERERSMVAEAEAARRAARVARSRRMMEMRLRLMVG